MPKRHGARPRRLGADAPEPPTGGRWSRPGNHQQEAGGPEGDGAGRSLIFHPCDSQASWSKFLQRGKNCRGASPARSGASAAAGASLCSPAIQSGRGRPAGGVDVVLVFPHTCHPLRLVDIAALKAARNFLQRHYAPLCFVAGAVVLPDPDPVAYAKVARVAQGAAGAATAPKPKTRGRGAIIPYSSGASTCRPSCSSAWSGSSLGHPPKARAAIEYVPPVIGVPPSPPLSPSNEPFPTRQQIDEAARESRKACRPPSRPCSLEHKQLWLPMPLRISVARCVAADACIDSWTVVDSFRQTALSWGEERPSSRIDPTRRPHVEPIATHCDATHRPDEVEALGRSERRAIAAYARALLYDPHCGRSQRTIHVSIATILNTQRHKLNKFIRNVSGQCVAVSMAGEVVDGMDDVPSLHILKHILVHVPHLHLLDFNLTRVLNGSSSEVHLLGEVPPFKNDSTNQFKMPLEPF
eukprot:GHVT01041736.1.p1 GENE.GHVT01041736.1~~GHVT01041736.1.p1  ORF type:complete len:468 (+),score=89.92 GHVT01041736.1:435-1838(+)